MAILSFSDLLEKSKKENKAIYEIAQEEEALLAETEVDVIRLKVTENLIAMREAIKNGLKSTEKSVSNWCGDDCVKLPERYKKNLLY